MVPDARGTTPSLHLQATQDGAGSCETLTCLISATCSKDSSHRGDCSIILFFVGQHSHSHLFVLGFFAHNGGTTLCLCLFWTAELSLCVCREAAAFSLAAPKFKCEQTYLPSPSNWKSHGLHWDQEPSSPGTATSAETQARAIQATTVLGCGVFPSVVAFQDLVWKYRMCVL